MDILRITNHIYKILDKFSSRFGKSNGLNIKHKSPKLSFEVDTFALKYAFNRFSKEMFSWFCT